MSLLKNFFSFVFIISALCLKGADQHSSLLPIENSTGDVILSLDSAERINVALTTINHALYEQDSFMEDAFNERMESISLESDERFQVQEIVHNRLITDSKKIQIASIAGIVAGGVLIAGFPIVMNRVCSAGLAEPGGYRDVDVARLCGMSTGALAQSGALMVAGAAGATWYRFKQSKNVSFLKRIYAFFTNQYLVQGE